MILVQVRHVQVARIAETVPVQVAVVGEHEPRLEIRRVHPWVAQDRPVAGLDMQPSMTQVCDSHSLPPVDIAGRVLACKTAHEYPHTTAAPARQCFTYPLTRQF